MEYNVIMPDGSKFAANNLTQINDWIAEGRILPTTVIERISDGARGPASMLPGVVFPAAVPATPPSMFAADVVTPPPANLAAPAASAPTTPPHSASPATPTAPAAVDASKSTMFKEPDYQRPAQHQPETLDEMGKPMSYVSYSREHTDRNVVPVELRGKFNWGAFFLTWIWGLAHRAWISLLALVLGLAIIPFSSGGKDGAGSTGIIAAVGVLQLGFMIFLGFMGNTWAWKSGRFKTPEDCRSCQNAWGQWGCGLFVFSLLVGLILVIVLVGAVRSALRL